MSSLKVRCLGISSAVVDRLQKYGINTCKDVLKENYLDLMSNVNVSQSTALQILFSASRACMPSSTTALELYQSKRNKCEIVSTLLKDLDDILHGGIQPGAITEVTGPSGCGKTLFSTMLCSTVVASSCQASAIYIDTEGAFAPQRLIEILVNRYSQFTDDESIKSAISRVLVYRETTSGDLLKRLDRLEETIITHNVKLIVIDSITSPARHEFDVSSSRAMIDRSNWLLKITASLKYTADAFSIPVVVTNQITTRFGEVKRSLNNKDDDDDDLNTANVGYVTAALGNSWSHCVNTRLILQYTDCSNNTRQILVAKSPVAPFVKFNYSIQAAGIVLEGGGADYYCGTNPTFQKILPRS